MRDQSRIGQPCIGAGTHTDPALAGNRRPANRCML